MKEILKYPKTNVIGNKEILELPFKDNLPGYSNNGISLNAKPITPYLHKFNDTLYLYKLKFEKSTSELTIIIVQSLPDRTVKKSEMSEITDLESDRPKKYAVGTYDTWGFYIMFEYKAKITIDVWADEPGKFTIEGDKIGGNITNPYIGAFSNDPSINTGNYQDPRSYINPPQTLQNLIAAGNKTAEENKTDSWVDFEYEKMPEWLLLTITDDITYVPCLMWTGLDRREYPDGGLNNRQPGVVWQYKVKKSDASHYQPISDYMNAIKNNKPIYPVTPFTPKDFQEIVKEKGNTGREEGTKDFADFLFIKEQAPQSFLDLFGTTSNPNAPLGQIRMGAPFYPPFEFTLQFISDYPKKPNQEPVRFSESDISSGLDEFKKNARLLYLYMENYKDVKVKIEGYTDSIGEESANMDLSQRRADAVKDYLVTLGIEASRITTEGLGEQLVPTGTESNEEKYRKTILLYTK